MTIRNQKQQQQMRLLKKLVSITVFLGLLVGACERSKPIDIGFVGGLTGRLSDLGVDGRDGAELAIEIANQAGGINDKPVRLIVKDDEQRPETAVRVVGELFDAGVIAVVGHMTSTMTMATLPLFNERKMVLVSPTTSANVLTSIDDQLIRLMPATKLDIEYLADHLYERQKIDTVVIVSDDSNQIYSDDWSRTFKGRFEGLGGRVIGRVRFTSGTSVVMLRLMDEVLGDDPKGLVIVAGAVDAAGLCQQLRKAGSPIPVAIAGWALNHEFLYHGGPAVEGALFMQFYDITGQQPTFLDFKQRFRQRFGRDPDFGASYAYEATRVLLDALTRADDPQAIKRAILEKGVYDGLQGDIVFDRFGDADRRRFLITVKNNGFMVQP
jgi:branched-chain amino acid transport system substrate-binding protein